MVLTKRRLKYSNLIAFFFICFAILIISSCGGGSTSGSSNNGNNSCNTAIVSYAIPHCQDKNRPTLRMNSAIQQMDVHHDR